MESRRHTSRTGALGSDSCPLELSGSSENRIALKPGGALDKPGRRVSSSRPSSRKAKKKPSTKSLCRKQAEERQVPYTSSQPTLVMIGFFFFHEVGNKLCFGFCFKTRSLYVVHSGLRFTEIHLTLIPKC